jgi:hypothetical protein
MNTRNKGQRIENYYTYKPELFRLVAKKIKNPKNLNINLEKDENLKLFSNSMQTYILEKLQCKSQPPPTLVVDVTPKTLAFLVNSFGMTKKFSNDCGEKILEYFKIKTHQYFQNCQQNKNIKYFIKANSFQAKQGNNRKVIDVDEINGQLVYGSKAKNLKVHIKFERDLSSPLTQTQSDWVKRFISERLAKRASQA